MCGFALLQHCNQFPFSIEIVKVFVDTSLRAELNQSKWKLMEKLVQLNNVHIMQKKTSLFSQYFVLILLITAQTLY